MTLIEFLKNIALDKYDLTDFLKIYLIYEWSDFSEICEYFQCDITNDILLYLYNHLGNYDVAQYEHKTSVESDLTILAYYSYALTSKIDNSTYLIKLLCDDMDYCEFYSNSIDKAVVLVEPYTELITKYKEI